MGGGGNGGAGAGDSANGSNITGGAVNGGYTVSLNTEGDLYGAGGGASASSGSAGARGEVRVTYYLAAESGYPYIASRSYNRATSASVTSHAITMPSDIVAGDILLVVFTNDGSATTSLATDPGDWTHLGTAANSTLVRSSIFYKAAEGSDTLTVTTSASEGSSHIVLLIKNGGTPTATSANGASTNANPPSHDAGSSAKYLWIATGGWDTDQFVANVGPNASPTSYGDFVIQPNSIAAGSVLTALSTRNAEAQIEDPGTYTSGNEQWVAFTIAVPYNVAPASPTSPTQLKSDDATSIANEGYTEETEVILKASATDADTTETLTLFFELVANADSFTSEATPTIGGSCASATAYSDCASKVWYITSSSGDYSATPFTGTTTVATLTDATGYKWQVKACDDDSACSDWVVFNATTPNFTIDTSAPTIPGTPTATTPTTDTTPEWTWDASTDEGAGLHSTEPYIVEWSTDSTFTSTTGTSTVTTASFTHTTALADGTWYFRVKAKDALDNESAYSANGSLAIDTSVPAAASSEAGGTTGSASAGTAWLQEHGYLPSPEPTPPPSIVQRILEPLIPPLFRPTPPVEPEPIEEDLVPKEPPLALQGVWQLLPQEPIQEFVLGPLPRAITSLADKFPELAHTLEQVGITKITDLSRLRGSKLFLPGFGQVSQDIPSDVVFAALRQDQGKDIDIPATLTLTEQGEPQQRINVIVNYPVHLALKPEQPAQSIKGYLVFRSRKTSGIANDAFLVSNQAPTSLPVNSLLASAFFAPPAFAQTANLQDLETRLVLLEFDYSGPDEQGLWTADILAPAVEGEYEIINVIEYQDPDLGTRAIRLITVVDPEGYVYERSGNREIRVPEAVVSLFWLNPDKNQYELWPAREYQQENPQTTDITGKYSFLAPEGSYFLAAEAPGYLPYESDVFSLREGSPVNRNVEMRTRFGWVEGMDWKTAALIVLGALLFYNFLRDRMKQKSNIKTQNAK